jgi:hypothetical protein
MLLESYFRELKIQLKLKKSNLVRRIPIKPISMSKRIKIGINNKINKLQIKEYLKIQQNTKKSQFLYG